MELSENYTVVALALNYSCNNSWESSSKTNLCSIYKLMNDSKMNIDHHPESKRIFKIQSPNIYRDSLKKIAKEHQKTFPNTMMSNSIIYNQSNSASTEGINMVSKYSRNVAQANLLQIKDQWQLLLNIAITVVGLLTTIGLLYCLRFQISKNGFCGFKFTTAAPSKKDSVGTDKPAGIPKEKIEDILKKLENFENEKKFLTKNLTLNLVAKRLDTNPTYLSKVINFYKNKNFASYLNEARVNYAINVLKNNTLFRRYTIGAIAEECGFNKADSFSSCFYKKTGLRPSCFIKQLDKVTE